MTHDDDGRGDIEKFTPPRWHPQNLGPRERVPSYPPAHYRVARAADFLTLLADDSLVQVLAADAADREEPSVPVVRTSRGRGRRTRLAGRAGTLSTTLPRFVRTPIPARRRCRSGASRVE